MSNNLTITDNTAARRYETHLEGYTAHVDYEHDDDMMVITHTIVPQELGGRGIAADLTRHVLDDARSRGLKVDPLCSYTRTWITRHPEYQSLSVQHGA